MFLNLMDLNKLAEQKINPKTLLNAGLVREIKNGVKILGEGEIKRAVIIEGCQVSEGARKKIENAGGSVK